MFKRIHFTLLSIKWAQLNVMLLQVSQSWHGGNKELKKQDI